MMTTTRTRRPLPEAASGACRTSSAACRAWSPPASVTPAARVPRATYRNHGSTRGGIEIHFDPEKLSSYRRLLEFFFRSTIHHPQSPGQRRRQFLPLGHLCVNERQREIAVDTIADVNASGLWRVRWSPRSNRWGLLGGGAGAPGLPEAPSRRLYLPLSAAELGIYRRGG